MKEHIVKSLLIVFLSVLWMPLCAQNVDTSKRDVILSPEIVRFRDGIYNNSFSEIRMVISAYDEAIEATATLSQGSYEQLVQLSRCEYYYALSESHFEKKLSYENGSKSDITFFKKDLVRHFKKSLEYAKASIELKNGSDGYALCAWAQYQLCVYGSLDYRILNASKIRDYAQKAFYSNPNNGSAHIVECLSYINSTNPLVNRSEYIEKMERFIPEKKVYLEHEDIFIIYYTLSAVYEAKKDKSSALSMIDSALNFYPMNFMAQIQKKRINEL